MDMSTNGFIVNTLRQGPWHRIFGIKEDLAYTQWARRTCAEFSQEIKDLPHYEYRMAVLDRLYARWLIFRARRSQALREDDPCQYL